MTQSAVKRRFTPVRLNPAELRSGLTRELARPVPTTPIAVLKSEPPALEERLGVRFQETFDGLDQLKISVLRLPSGRAVSLLRHKGSPTPGTLVAALEHDAGADALSETLSTLELPETEVAWRGFPFRRSQALDRERSGPSQD